MATKQLNGFGSVVRSVRASRLFVDRIYQRELNEGRITHLTSCYNEVYIGVLIVKKRGNRYAIVNGQHAFVTAGKKNPGYKKTNGHEMKFNCVVLPDWVDEALAFVHFNDQKPVTKNQKFKAFLHSKTDGEGDVQKAIVEELGVIGLELVFGAGRRSHNPVKQTRNAWSFEKMYMTLGHQRFRLAMQILELYKVNDEQYSLDDGFFQSATLTADFLNGLTRFLSSTERSDGEVLVGIDYAGIPAATVRDKALHLSTDGYSRECHVAEILHEVVEQGLQQVN